MNKDIKLSNLKGLLIFLVVLGHLLALYKADFKALYLLIYSFHMPLFILVSGYFAKNATLKKTLNFVLLYLIFQPFYQMILVVLEQRKFDIDLQIPYYHMWYLVSMTIWYLLAVILRKLSQKPIHKFLIIILCFVIGIGAKFLSGITEPFLQNYNSLFNSYYLSYQRTLSFLPFFFIGFYLNKEEMQHLYQQIKAKKLMGTFVIVSFYLYFLLSDTSNEERILKGSFGINKLKGDVLQTSINIFVGYLIALVMCYIVLNLISSKKSFLTIWGDRSLPIFLFHTVFVIIAKQMVFLQEMHPLFLLIHIIATTLIIVMALSSDGFIAVTRYLCYPLAALDAISRQRYTGWHLPRFLYRQ